MATFFNINSTPADNGTQAGPTVAVAPPGSMVAGDLVCMVAGYKNSGVTMAVSATGGQTWTSETAGGGATSGLTIRLFWCRFNGTWGANPSVTITSGTLAMSVHLLVFRPNAGSSTWSVSAAMAVTDQGASANIAPVARAIPIGDMGFSACISNDDNTYTSGGGGYTLIGTQFRNLQGNDIAMGFAYKESVNNFTDNPVWQQATLGNDTWATLFIGFHENPVTVFIAQPPLSKLQAVKRSNHY